MTTIVLQVDNSRVQAVRRQIQAIDGVHNLRVHQPEVEDDDFDDDNTSPEDPALVAELRESLTRGFAEIREARAKGELAGRPLRELLNEL